MWRNRRAEVPFAGLCFLGAVLSLSCHAVNLVVPSGEMTRFENTAKSELCTYLAKVTGEKVEVVRNHREILGICNGEDS